MLCKITFLQSLGIRRWISFRMIFFWALPCTKGSHFTCNHAPHPKVPITVSSHVLKSHLRLNEVRSSKFYHLSSLLTSSTFHIACRTQFQLNFLQLCSKDSFSSKFTKTCNLFPFEPPQKPLHHCYFFQESISD